MVVGMPFKDIATSDTLFMREVKALLPLLTELFLLPAFSLRTLIMSLSQIPAADDETARQALRRLAEVGVHVMAPVAALEATPLPGAVAILTLKVRHGHACVTFFIPEAGSYVAVGCWH